MAKTSAVSMCLVCAFHVSAYKLTDQEKEEYEEKFGDPSEGNAPDEIANSAMNKWLFNTDTVDKVLEVLMTKGIMVEGGDKLGKTIVFAKNHNHAVFIEKRFNKNYPEYSGKFLRVIDNYETKAQDLLETFVDPYEEHKPQIAVSVDMMDTGVDAPRVANLVFFKEVRSSSKFWQMIGRGTRLCPNLFFEGEDKEHFLIFDVCKNFEFFDANPEGAKGNAVKGLTQVAFESKLEIALLIRGNAESSEEQKELAESYINDCYESVAKLDRDRFVVKAKLRTVVEYCKQSNWGNISKSDVLDIYRDLSALVLSKKGDDELAKRFDVLILKYQFALLSSGVSTDGYMTNISGIASQLLKKTNIPDVATQVDVLNRCQTDQFWADITINQLDAVRIALRDLIKYLDKQDQKNIITHFDDEVGSEVREEKGGYQANSKPLKTYKERVEKYLRSHSDHLVIQKLKTNKPITEKELHLLESILFDNDEVGTREEYEESYGSRPLGEFIRNIVGMDITAAQSAFADFIQVGTLSGDQLTFINSIISHLTENGIVDKKMLFEPPFTNIHDQGLFGVFDDAEASKVVKLIDKVNSNATANSDSKDQYRLVK